jgi:hypothetical protein
MTPYVCLPSEARRIAVNIAKLPDLLLGFESRAARKGESKNHAR